MGIYNTIYYYIGNNDLILNRLSIQQGMLFCSISNMDNKKYKDEIDYYDPVRKRYITKTFKTRKNITLEYYSYNPKEKDFNKILLNNKIYNRRYTNNFINKNFIDINKIKDKLDIIYRMKKIEKIKNNLN